MPPLQLQDDLRPLSDLKAHAADVVKQATDTGRPVVLTKHGRGVAVLLSVADYDALVKAAASAELQSAVEAAERDLAEGNATDDKHVRARLKRWADGGR